MRIYEVQGAYFLLFHSHLLCLPENIPALEEFVNFCKGKDVWFATGEDMADWWRSLENVSLTLEISSGMKTGKRDGSSKI
ncbi:MAG: hypothetical protein ABIK18_03000, partial [candidate division WOR-3 bacterium]